MAQSSNDPQHRPVSNLLGLAVLSYLTQRPMHAYELQRQFKENDAATTFKLSYGALYSVVRQLLREGFIAVAGSGRTGNQPEHTIYELTEAGEREKRSWLRELLATPRHEYPAFAAALSLVIVLPPAEVTELLRTRLSRVEQNAADIDRRKDDVVQAGVHPVFLVEDDYRVALLHAEARFIRVLLERINNPDTGWISTWDRYLAGITPPSEGEPT